MKNYIIKIVLIFFTLSFCIFVQVENPSAQTTDVQNLMAYKAKHGLNNLEPQSIALINMGLKAMQENKKEEAIALFNNAKDLSPNLPGVYLHLAKANFSFSIKGFYTMINYLKEAAQAFLNNFWWPFQTTGIILLSIIIALYVSVVVIVGVLVYSKFSFYAHDIVENKKKIFLLLPSVIFVILGPIFGIMAFILPFWVYMKKKEKILLYCLLLISLLIILIIPSLSSFLGASNDRVLKTIVRIVEGTYTSEDPGVLKDDEAYESAFAYAIYLKRKGQFKEAIEIYKRLLKKQTDSRLYNNLANCYVGLGDYTSALTYYSKALESKKMASTYYNLSQIYREKFKFREADEYYEEALKLDNQKVSAYRAMGGGTSININRFVMDETLTNKELWALVFKRVPSYRASIFFRRMLSLTNTDVSLILILLIAITFLIIYSKTVSNKIYKCRRCGKVYCERCEKKLPQDNICVLCYKILGSPSRISPQERIEKILNIQHYKDVRNMRVKILNLIFPGSGHIYYGRPFHGFSFLLLFTFFLCSIILWSYMLPSPPMNQIASLFKWIFIIGLIPVYGLSIKLLR